MLVPLATIGQHATQPLTSILIQTGQPLMLPSCELSWSESPARSSVKAFHIRS
jgi:hypothetical protein